ncbi:carbohydrate ABC transporter permease, partial [Enterococcus faecium]|nr:carbohydrate ABC transporter permease [Enterococcus faecium]
MTKQKIQSRIFTYVIIVFGALIFLMPYLYMIVAST